MKKYTFNLSIYRYFLTFLLVFTGFSKIASLTAQIPEGEKFYIKGAADERVTLPFELINNLIVVEAQINGSEPLKLIFDSGVSNTIITSLYDKEVSLNNTRPVYISGLGQGEPIRAFYSESNVIEMGSMIGISLDLVFLREDYFSFSYYMGTEIHGLIGYDILANFAVEIDYKKKVLRLYDPVAFEKKFEKLPRHRKWHKFPLSFENQKPYLNVGYKHAKSDSVVMLKLLVDCGSSNAFLLYALTDENIKIPNARIETLIGIGLSGNIQGHLGRVEEMKLGEFIFQKPVVAYPDSQSIWRALEVTNRNGSVGGDVLRRFKVIFNYHEEALFVRKNSDFGDDFRYNISGIEINTPLINLPYYVVSDVRENSPAYQAGIKKGDVIVSVNGVPASGLSLSELINFLQNEKGQRLLIKVKRDSTFNKFQFEVTDKLIVDKGF